MRLESGHWRQIFIFYKTTTLALRVTQPPAQYVPGGISPSLKLPMCEIDQSPSTSTDLKNSWSYICTVPKRLHCMGRDNFVFNPFKCLSVHSSLPPSDFSVGIVFPSYLPCLLHNAILVIFTLHTCPTLFHSMIMKTVVGAKSLKQSNEQEIVPVKIQQTAYLNDYTELDLLVLSGATAIMPAQCCIEVAANGKDL